MRSKRHDELEAALRAARPRPSSELVSRIEARVRESRPARRRSFGIAVPVAMTAALVGALVAVGGVGYAASSVTGAVHSVAKIFTPAKGAGTLTIAGATAGGDQYRPGFGFGDPNHNHTGPPGLKKKEAANGAFAPPLTPKVKGKTATITTSITLDEQAHLFISVIDTKTKKPILITQSKSKVGNGLKGKQAKTVNYEVLVPRTIPLKLTLPSNLVVPGRKYAIQVIARDPDGNQSKLLIPFKG